MMMLEKPSMIVGLGRLQCVLHIQPHNVVFVPGMSDEHEPPGFANFWVIFYSFLIILGLS